MRAPEDRNPMTDLPDIQPIAVTPRSAAFLLTPGDALYTLPEPIDWVLERGGRVVASGHCDTVSLFVEGLEPDRDYHLRLPRSGAEAVFRTLPCAGLIDITDFGASPDVGDNSAAFARAVDAVPPGGTLMVPAGRFVTGPIFLKPRMTLHVAMGAELAARGDRLGWPILPARDDAGRPLGSWEGLPEASFASLITALDCDDLRLTGAGVIDGGGDRGDWWTWPKETRAGARRPRTVFLSYCSDVSLTGLTIRNSPSWTVHPRGCVRLVATGLTISNPSDSPNTDGFNPESCRTALLAGIRFSVGDDCIAIKAGKRGAAGEDHLAPTRGIRIVNSRMERGHGAVVIGSEMSGDITDVDIVRCEFQGTDRGLRIKTRRGRGGKVARISLRDSVMDGVHTPLAVNAFYFCDPDGRDDWVQSRAPAPLSDTTPEIADIAFENIRASGVHLAVAAILGLPEARIRGVRITGVQVSYAEEAVAAPPLMACDVEPVRHAGIISENAEVQADDILPLAKFQVSEPC